MTMTPARKEFENRLASLNLPHKKDSKFTIWYIWKNVTLRTKEKGYMVCYWTNTEEYAGRKQLYDTVDYACNDSMFLLNLLGRTLKDIPDEYKPKIRNAPHNFLR